MTFVKGVSGNPGGRPKQKPALEALIAELNALGEDHRALRTIMRSIIHKAMLGDLACAAFVTERLDGKVPQPVGGSDELGPTRLHITWSPTEQQPMQVIEGEAAQVLDQTKTLNGS